MGVLRRFLGIRGVNWTGERPEDGEIYKKALAIAWPATIEGALLSIISAADTAMVRVVDKYAIAAVSLTAQPRMILLIIAQALCVGTTALIARRKGEGDRAGANSVLSQSMALITAVGILVSLAGYFLAEPILDLAGAADETRQMAVDYFRIIAAGLIFNCWSLCLCAALRAIGNTRITMVTNITANLVNVFLNYCLIGGNLGFPKLGVRGAAIATVCGTAVSCAIAFVYATRPDGYLIFRLKGLKFDRHTLSGLMKVGSSSMAESVFLRLGFFINTRMIADIGADELTSYNIVQQVTGLSFTLGDGVATAGATMVGQSLGAQRKDKAMAYVKASRKISMIASFLLMAVIFFARRGLALIFTEDETIIAGASLAFTTVVFGIMAQNGRVVFSGCLRGAGDVKYVAFCSLVSVAIIRPLLTYVLCYPLNQALPALQLAYTGPWIAFVIDAYIREALLYARVRRGTFLNIKL